MGRFCARTSSDTRLDTLRSEPVEIISKSEWINKTARRERNFRSSESFGVQPTAKPIRLEAFRNLSMFVMASKMNGFDLSTSHCHGKDRVSNTVETVEDADGALQYFERISEPASLSRA